MNEMKKAPSNNEKNVIVLFFLIPTMMLIIGYYLFSSSTPTDQPLVYIPLFLGLILLGTGFLLKEKNLAGRLKIIGWGSFSFFWAMMPSFLYHSEGGDVFNAVVSIIGVYVLFYMAYHEWLSIKRNEYISCLDWIAGGSFIAGMIYFIIDSDILTKLNILPGLKDILIDIVAAHSTALLNILGLSAIREGNTILYNGVPITIIFACTAIQASVLFIGMIGALHKSNIKRRIIAIVITVIPIYFLNLVRNASVIFLVGGNITSFNIAHNVLSKIGALITLIALLFLVFRILPELYDEITCIFNLVKRKGPIENFFSNLSGKKVK